MIVRTYTRRNRGVNDTGYDSEGFREPLSQDGSSQEIFDLPFSSQDPSSCSLDESDIFLPVELPRKSTASRPPKKRRTSASVSEANGKNGVLRATVCKTSLRRTTSVPATSTLMEAQEFGEMMEHVDEANFALDGIQPGRPLRVQRASLLSLLSVCSTPQQRRLLRVQGVAKEILDAILFLNTDDSPCAVAASALFFALTNDGQDEHLLESPAYIRFLLKLLTSHTLVDIDKKPTVGVKLLAVCKSVGFLSQKSKGIDSTITAILSKVQDLLVNCKELHMDDCIEGVSTMPHLSSKWIALLTIEKACLSTISLEDTSGSVRRVGGNFKEKLRELGGLDTVFDVVLDCSSVLEVILNGSTSPLNELKSGSALESLTLLAKCLKIMENSTFLSKDNQNHLLEISAKLGSDGSSKSFIGHIIDVIKVLSGICLSRSSPMLSSEGVSYHDHVLDTSYSQTSNMELDIVLKGRGHCMTEDFGRSSTSCSYGGLSDSDVLGFIPDTNMSHKACLVKSNNDFSSLSYPDREKLSLSESSHEIANSSTKSSKNSGLQNNIKNETHLKSPDPFAFDEDDVMPNKWGKLLSTRGNSSQNACTKTQEHAMNDGEEVELIASSGGTTEIVSSISSQGNISPSADKVSKLLGECLLTAVKVLMNLTNDNSLGCTQTGANGGLDILAHLIVGHFPSFHIQSLDCNHQEKVAAPYEPDTGLQDANHFNDQEMDFLVAILGLLVNLVEKDSANRARLAASRISLPVAETKRNCVDVLPLLCSIFLSNHGAGESVKETTLVSWNDEASVLQEQHEAEKMIIEAYTALLLAFLSTESGDAREAIACHLPDNNLRILVPVLERFVGFHMSLNMISEETHAAVSEVIECCRAL